MPRSDSAGPGALDGSRLPRADRPDPKRPDSLAVAHAGGRRADQAREPEAPTFRMAARHWLVPRRAAGGLRATVAGGDGAPPSRAHAPRPLSRGDGRRQRRRRRAALHRARVPRLPRLRVLARGFARVRCDACRFERLVPFSCKTRAVCPSCGGRRMAEQAAHLVDAVLPFVPVRQWVLTVPHRLRYRLAFGHALIRAVLGWYRRRGRRAGVPDGQSGTVTVVQRFGSGLELNVHFLVAPLLRAVVETKRLHAAGRRRRLQELLLKGPAQEVGSPLPPFRAGSRCPAGPLAVHGSAGPRRTLPKPGGAMKSGRWPASHRGVTGNGPTRGRPPSQRARSGFEGDV